MSELVVNKSLFPSLSKSNDSHPPSRRAAGQRAQSCRGGDILKLTIPQILIEGKTFAEHRSFKDVRPSIVVDIPEIRAHAGDGVAECVVRNPGEHCDIGESPIPVVVKKIVFEGIVGDEDVGKPIVVVVGKRQTHAFANILGNVGLFGDVSKSAVAVVAVEDVRHSQEIDRRAVGRKSLLNAESCRADSVIEVVHDKKVEPPVVVVIEPSRGY